MLVYFVCVYLSGLVPASQVLKFKFEICAHSPFGFRISLCYSLFLFSEKMEDGVYSSVIRTRFRLIFGFGFGFPPCDALLLGMRQGDSGFRPQGESSHEGRESLLNFRSSGPVYSDAMCIQ